MGKELSLNILEIARKVKKLEESGGSGGGGEADDVTYDPTASHLEATNVQDAIDELSGEIAGMSADDVSYDGTDSGLSAVTVQSAIDETVNKLEDALNELSKPAIGTTVDISIYNSASNYYECPSDGYVRILGTSSSVAWAYILQTGTASNYAIAQSTGLYVAVPVRKGARIYVLDVSNASFMSMADYT